MLAEFICNKFRQHVNINGKLNQFLSKYPPI